MRCWQLLPEVILSAWLQRGGGEQDPLIRLSAWRVLVPQPIDLSGDLIRHLPAEFNIGVLMLMADWFPLAGSPLPEGFWGALEQSIISLFRPCLQLVCFERSGEICSPVATGRGRRNPGCVVYVEKIHTDCSTWKDWILTDELTGLLSHLSQASWLAAPAPVRVSGGGKNLTFGRCNTYIMVCVGTKYP